MHFCIFSYNRGQHLANCGKSVEYCAASPQITIYADDSDDAQTRAVLASLRDQYKVINTKAQSDSQTKCGGLYNNMQSAIHELPKGSLVCFLQDDLRLVRKLDSHDFSDIAAYFSNNPSAAFLQPALLRASNRIRNEKNT